MKPTTLSRIAAALTASAMTGILPAGASPVDVPNAGFERRGEYDPFADGVDKYNQAAGTQNERWRHWMVDNNGGPLRIWNPGAVGVTPQGFYDVGFGGVAAQGDYCVVVNTRYNDNEFTNAAPYPTDEFPTPVRDFEAAAQILDAELFDHTKKYTLTAQVGRLPGSSYYTANWYGYAVQLCVGGTNVNGSQYAHRVEGGKVVAQDWNTVTVPIDTWATSTVVYNPGDWPDATLDGLPIQIRLCALEIPENHALTCQVAFDDVKLEADVVPVGDVTPPTLASTDIVDDKSGGPVEANVLLTYTVTFGEAMDAASVIAAGFTNAGTAPVTFGALTSLGGGVFTVQVTPETAGTLQLQVPMGAVMTDVSGNALDTSAAIPDDTTITVNATTPVDGTWIADASGVWSNPANWSLGSVADGTDQTAFFTANITGPRTVSVDTPRTIGNITFDDDNQNLVVGGTSILTLSVSSGSPVIDVITSGRTLSITAPLASNDGLVKNGGGILSVPIPSISGDTTINAGTLEIGAGSGSYAGNISIASGATLSHNADALGAPAALVLGGVISGDGNLSKNGRSRLELTNDNTYTGVTTGSGGGLLLLSSANALPGGIGATGGTGALTLNNGVLGLGAGDFSRPITAQGTAGGVFFLGNGGWAAFGADRTVNIGGAGDPIVWADAAAGFNGKNLLFGSTSGRPNVTDGNPSTHKVTLVNPIDLGTAARTVTVENGANTGDIDGELSGVISGDGGLIKANYGTLALSGTNTYLGPTTVGNNGGTLLINGDQSAATGTVTITGVDASLGGANGPSILGGSGTLGGTVVLTANANLAPGASAAAAGTLSILGDLDVAAMAGGAGRLIYQLGALAGTNDLTAVTGTLLIGTDVLGFTNFTFTDLGGLEVGTYKLVTSGNPVNGTLDPADLSGPIGALTGTLNINGNDLELVVSVGGGGNNFADWIAGYPGLGAMTSFTDDPDGDGNGNGLENFFGTDPSAFTAGVTAGQMTGNTFTFSHPQNATPADDVSAPAYTWSTDLATFTAGGVADGNGTTVTFAPVLGTPAAGTTTVTATITGTPINKLFVRVAVTQEP